MRPPYLFAIFCYLTMPRLGLSHAHVKISPTATAVSTEHLAAAFAYNEVQAEDRFEGRRLAVRGRVYFVQRAADSPSIEMDCHTPTGYKALLVCTGYGQGEAAALQAGDMVTVEGTFHKMLYCQFVLTDCRVRKRPETRRGGRIRLTTSPTGSADAGIKKGHRSH